MRPLYIYLYIYIFKEGPAKRFDGNTSFKAWKKPTLEPKITGLL